MGSAHAGWEELVVSASCTARQGIGNLPPGGTSAVADGLSEGAASMDEAWQAGWEARPSSAASG